GLQPSCGDAGEITLRQRVQRTGSYLFPKGKSRRRHDEAMKKISRGCYSRRYHAETPPLRRAATAAAAVVSVLVQERGWRTRLPTQMPESKKVPGAPKDPSPCREHRVTAKRTASNVGTNEVKTSVFVNLRQAPSPSAKVIRVVAKGTKLPVVAHKGR